MDVELERIQGFRSPGEVKRFEDFLDQCLRNGALEEGAVREPFSGSDLWKERWFRRPGTDDWWRLVLPDPPFTGVFEPVRQG